MHIFFSGIGGAGIGPLALVAHEAGFSVSGSDKQSSAYIDYLKKSGLNDIYVGQTEEAIAKVHEGRPIDWFVYSSAVSIENPEAPELVFSKKAGIKSSKRDELLNYILKEKNLKLIAVAGTHGKTTTTAMAVFLFKELGVPVSYLLPAKTSFAEMGSYNPDGQYFIYEADEFDRNFLAFAPHISLITGVSWDHHEIFKTRDNYKQAFRDFIEASAVALIWREDADYLNLDLSDGSKIKSLDEAEINGVDLLGRGNRKDAWLALQSVKEVLGKPTDHLVETINRFPGLSRRMEMILPNLYSDYAHTPEKIRGALSVASEMSEQSNQSLVIVYEPLTNRRQHYMIKDYGDSFNGASVVYWLPSYLAREDPTQKIISPSELIANLADPSLGRPMKRDNELKETIQKHLGNGDMVVGLAGGGGGSLDDWLRQEFKQ